MKTGLQLHLFQPLFALNIGFWNEWQYYSLVYYHNCVVKKILFRGLSYVTVICHSWNALYE
jgi:hypothetical protein